MGKTRIGKDFYPNFRRKTSNGRNRRKRRQPSLTLHSLLLSFLVRWICNLKLENILLRRSSESLNIYLSRRNKRNKHLCRNENNEKKRTRRHRQRTAKSNATKKLLSRMLILKTLREM